MKRQWPGKAAQFGKRMGEAGEGKLGKRLERGPEELSDVFMPNLTKGNSL